MITIKRILVPTDLSDASIPAIRYGAEFADKFGAELVLLSVVHDLALVVPDAVMPTPVGAPDLEALIATSKDGMASLIGELDIGRLKPRTEVRMGAPAAEIVAAAGDLKADLICLGTHGRGGLAHLLLGSVAEKVIRHAPCPVLTVRSGTGGAEPVK
jgi:nucleotide-binding universal stress UspA family protein